MFTDMLERIEQEYRTRNSIGLGMNKRFTRVNISSCQLCLRKRYKSLLKSIAFLRPEQQIRRYICWIFRKLLLSHAGHWSEIEHVQDFLQSSKNMLDHDI